MDAYLLKILSKFPFIFDGHFYDSSELKQNKYCVTMCKFNECVSHFSSLSNNLDEFTCPTGYDTVLLKFDGEQFIFNGLYYKTNSKLPKGTKRLKKEWKVEREYLLDHARNIIEVEKSITQKVNESTEKNFSMFHDFKTSMNVFFNCTHDIISKLPGDKFEDKLDNSPKEYKDLFNALELITSQLGMIDIIINPKSISFGNKKVISIYKLFYKLQILFGHLATKKKDVSFEFINTNNNYIKDSLCYESIEIIPLILLDNALKYSAPGSIIKIEMTQLHEKIRIKIKNIGPLVKDENIEKIFHKFFRGDAATEFSNSGIGMGLWIAKQVLEIHGSKLLYHKDSNAEGDIGLNIFEFELPTI